MGLFFTVLIIAVITALCVYKYDKNNLCKKCDNLKTYDGCMYNCSINGYMSKHCRICKNYKYKGKK